MIKDPVVSVYIVNHNYGRFLQQAIDSVLKQTLKDFEIIFIDNGSDDDSREKLKNILAIKKSKLFYKKILD